MSSQQTSVIVVESGVYPPAMPKKSRQAPDRSGVRPAGVGPAEADPEQTDSFPQNGLFVAPYVIPFRLVQVRIAAKLLAFVG
ncbi:hypothetical protein CBM2589_A70117 [Cupriavidus taiwanensis]|uniref:Uncharacterized protein n=1 Tax=Cupriavidus taiwanensis TaxID=164546 RepID=A0A975XAH9_9BURK|nr:hypothetical protein CBM2589_A70117 [Cupriavidus taiwanensis]